MPCVIGGVSFGLGTSYEEKVRQIFTIMLDVEENRSMPERNGAYLDLYDISQDPNRKHLITPEMKQAMDDFAWAQCHR